MGKRERVFMWKRQILFNNLGQIIQYKGFIPKDTNVYYQPYIHTDLQKQLFDDKPKGKFSKAFNLDDIDFDEYDEDEEE